MNRILTSVAAILLCGMLTFASADRGRNTHVPKQPNRTEQSNKHQSNRPGQAARPGNHTKPGNNNNQGATKPGNNRPGNGNNGNHKPGNNNNNHKPGNTHTQPGQRPGHNASQGNNYRPGNNWNHNTRPGGNNHGNHQPAPPPSHGHGHGPIRPHMPHHYGWYRPAPPPSWHAPSHWRPFQSVLGVLFGTTVNLTVNALLNSGYSVTSYGNNNVYVSNVPMLNMVWPDAVLFYNNAGGLCGSRFVYSTSYYDQGRYNAAYASLVNGYGAPMSLQNTANGGFEATWWGTGNQFIRLAYDAGYAQDGSLRYFTTLSFGD